MTLNSMLNVIGFSNQLISEDNSRWLDESSSWTYKTYTAVAVVFSICVYTNVSRQMEPFLALALLLIVLSLKDNTKLTVL